MQLFISLFIKVFITLNFYQIINFYVLLSLILNYLKSKDEPAWHGVFYVIMFTLAIVLESSFDTHQFYFLYLAGMKSKSLLITSLYRKVKMNLKCKDLKLKFLC